VHTERPKVIVFDFFGVVCPVLSGLTWAEFSRRHKINPVAFSRFGYDRREDLDYGRITEVDFATELKAKFLLSATVEQLTNELGELDNEYYAFNPDLHDLIEELKPQATLALMSNVSSEEGARMRALGAYDAFEQVFLSGDSGLTKSDPAWFEAVIAQLGVPASDIMLIDDMASNIEVAKAAGWERSVTYKDPADLRSTLVTYGYHLKGAR
jgi:HAD superfamily hydrolase (TIGR01509 family)